MKYLISLPLLIISLPLLIILSACGTFKYHQPAANPVLFKSKGETHVSGGLNSSGAAVQTGISVSDKIAIMANYNGTISSDQQNVREGELAAGIYSSTGSSAIFVSAGLGFGKNFRYTDETQTAKSYQGNILRPFIQFNGGITGGTILGGLKGDIVGVLKGSFLNYNGFNNENRTEKIRGDYATIEPGFAFGLGSNAFRMEFTFGFPTRPSFERLNSFNRARTFPATIGFNLHFIIGRENTLN